MYGEDVCLMAIPYGYQPIPCKAGDEPRGKGEGGSEFGEGASVERRCLVSKFEVVSVVGGYIVRYWSVKDLKMKSEVYSTSQELYERLDTLITEMEEE